MRESSGGEASAMRLAISSHPVLGKVSSRFSMAWTLSLTLAAFTVVAAAELTHDRLFHRDGSAPADDSKKVAAVDDPQKKPDHDKTTTVVMPEGKFQSSKIRVEPVETVEMPREFGVTGRIEADPNRRVEIRPRASGVVRSVEVAPGAKVKKGETLVILDSPDIGSARLLVRERQRALATVRVEAAWRHEIATNSEAMIEQLRKGTSAEILAKSFGTRRLGTTRGTLISAYADLEIAAHEAEKMTDLNQKKIVGEHPVFLAQHTRESAQARFDASLEQIRFDVSQQDRIARQNARDAEEMVVDAAQRLRILGVAEDIHELLDHPERASAMPSGSEDLTAYPIVAPFDGTIVSVSTVASQQVSPSDTMSLLADLSRVRTVANIPESDFSLLPGLNDGKVALTATAYPGRHFDSKMLYTGAEVDPVTRTVRLVAETENPDGLLKLGMFAKILLDTKTTEKATTVPAAAVVEVDGKSVVFVPGPGDRTFVIRPVKLGREALGRQVIVEGLKPGDQVVVSGAFVIKSELILQNETDEE